MYFYHNFFAFCFNIQCDILYMSVVAHNNKMLVRLLYDVKIRCVFLQYYNKTHHLKIACIIKFSTSCVLFTLSDIHRPAASHWPIVVTECSTPGHWQE
jgi:hypothetical protein